MPDKIIQTSLREELRCALRPILNYPKKNVYSQAVIALLILVSGSLAAQNPGEGRVLTMAQAVDIALRNAIELKNFELEKRSQKSLIMSEFNLASPTVSIETGQINSALMDYKLTVSQEIGFPMVYVEQVAAQKARADLTALLSDLKTVEVISEVRSIYMEWWITAARLWLKEKQDSIFGIFFSATARRFETGDVNELDLWMAETRKAKTELDVRTLTSELEAVENEMKTMIHSDTDYIAPSRFPERMNKPQLPEEGLAGNLTTRYLESSVRCEKANLRKESWKLAPSFTVGWFTQSLDEVEPYTGWTYGISLPVWFWVPMGRIKSARINRDIAYNEMENGMHHLESKWYRYRKDLEKADYTLSYFDEKGLNLSLSMISTAEKSYRAGEINLFQYIFTLNEAFSLQLEYLDALNRYNQTVIQINRLLGNP